MSNFRTLRGSRQAIPTPGHMSWVGMRLVEHSRWSPLAWFFTRCWRVPHDKSLQARRPRRATVLVQALRPHSGVVMSQDQEPGPQDPVTRFAAAERETIRRLWQLLGVFAAVFVASAIVAHVEKPGDTFGFDYIGAGVLAILVCLSRLSSGYRCPVCNKRPFHVFSKGLSSSYQAQRDLANEIGKGCCVNCGTRIRESRPPIARKRLKR